MYLDICVRRQLKTIDNYRLNSMYIYGGSLFEYFIISLRKQCRQHMLIMHSIFPTFGDCLTSSLLNWIKLLLWVWRTQRKTKQKVQNQFLCRLTLYNRLILVPGKKKNNLLVLFNILWLDVIMKNGSWKKFKVLHRCFHTDHNSYDEAYCAKET